MSFSHALRVSILFSEGKVIWYNLIESDGVFGLIWKLQIYVGYTGRNYYISLLIPKWNVQNFEQANLPNLKANANPDVSNYHYRFEKNNTYLWYISGKYSSAKMVAVTPTPTCPHPVVLTHTKSHPVTPTHKNAINSHTHS